MKILKNITSVLILVSGCVFNTHASTVKDYQLLVTQWLNLHKQRNLLASDWQNQKPLLEQRLMLLNIERQRLEQKLADSKQQNDQVSERRNHILQAQSQLESEQNALTLWLEQTLRYAHSQIPTLPPPLSSAWQEALSQISPDSSNSETLETLLLLQSQRHAFNQRISYEKSKVILENGENTLLEQLYIGEKLAYISTPDGSRTGLGYVTNDQWQWRLNNEIDSAMFQQAKAMLQHRQEAEFMALPIQLELSQ